jgi:hypothetical protein
MVLHNNEIFMNIYHSNITYINIISFSFFSFLFIIFILFTANIILYNFLVKQKLYIIMRDFIV